ELRQLFAVESSGDLETREVVGSATAMLLHYPMKAAAQEAQPAAQSAPRKGHAARLQRKIEGPPHPADFELTGQPRDCVEHRRQQMRVLDRIQMRRLQAAGQ